MRPHPQWKRQQLEAGAYERTAVYSVAGGGSDELRCLSEGLDMVTGAAVAFLARGGLQAPTILPLAVHQP